MAGNSVKIEAWAFQLDECSIPPALHPGDSARPAQFSNPTHRLRHERGRSALRSVLAIRLGIKPRDVAFEISPRGKPGVIGCEFSISHSGPWLVVAVSSNAVGIDIETSRRPRNVAALAARFFSVRDHRSLCDARDAERDRVFIRQWVAKEAALKCDGRGLAGLHKAECIMDESGISGVRWDAQQFSVHEFTLADGTPGAAAWRGDADARIEWRNAAEINVS